MCISLIFDVDCVPDNFVVVLEALYEEVETRWPAWMDHERRIETSICHYICVV